MAGRVGKIVSSTVAGIDLPGNDESRNVLRDVAKTRFPDDGGDPKVRRLLDWLVVADATETYREIAAGYDTFVREAQDRGITLQGLSRAPSLSDARITSDLVELWSTLPTRYPNIPVRADMVAEFLAQTAYLSTRDGIAARMTREFVDDFAGRDFQQSTVYPQSPPASPSRLE